MADNTLNQGTVPEAEARAAANAPATRTRAELDNALTTAAPDYSAARSARAVARSIEQQLRDLYERKLVAVSKLNARENVIRAQLIAITSQRENAEQQLRKVARALEQDEPSKQEALAEDAPRGAVLGAGAEPATTERDVSPEPTLESRLEDDLQPMPDLNADAEYISPR
jgi:hypothetical protein